MYMSRTNFTTSINVEVIEAIRKIIKTKEKGFISNYIEEGLRGLIEEEGGNKNVQEKEERRSD